MLSASICQGKPGRGAECQCEVAMVSGGDECTRERELFRKKMDLSGIRKGM